MIDPYGLDAPAFDELSEERVCGGKDAGILYPQAGEPIDVEKAPIVDLVRRRPPVRQPIGLDLEQLMERVEALGAADLAVDVPDRGLDLLADRRTFRDQPREACPRDFLLALAVLDQCLVPRAVFCGRLWLDRCRGVVGQIGEVLQRREDAQELMELRALGAELVRSAARRPGEGRVARTWG